MSGSFATPRYNCEDVGGNVSRRRLAAWAFFGMHGRKGGESPLGSMTVLAEREWHVAGVVRAGRVWTYAAGRIQGSV